MIQGDPLYYDAPDGTRWRVHDTRFTRGKPHVVSLGAAKANVRYFVNQAGERRAFTFQRHDSRALDEDTLAKHFAGAGWVSIRTFNPTTR